MHAFEFGEGRTASEPYLEILEEHDEDEDVVHGEGLLDEVAGKELHGGRLPLHDVQADAEGDRGADGQERPVHRLAVRNLGVHPGRRGPGEVGVLVVLLVRGLGDGHGGRRRGGGGGLAEEAPAAGGEPAAGLGEAGQAVLI